MLVALFWPVPPCGSLWLILFLPPPPSPLSTNQFLLPTSLFLSPHLIFQFTLYRVACWPTFPLPSGSTPIGYLALLLCAGIPGMICGPPACKVHVQPLSPWVITPRGAWAHAQKCSGVMAFLMPHQDYTRCPWGLLCWE